MTAPDGQITSSFPTASVQPLLKKYSGFQKWQISLYPHCPVPNEGRLAIVTNAGRDAVDADVPLTNGTEADGKIVWS